MTEVRVGGKYRYGKNEYTALTVWVTELLPGGKARVAWYTKGRKCQGRRYYLTPPARREKTVRLTSLRDPLERGQDT